MVERPERHLAAFGDAGADGITIHFEATPHANYALAAVRDAGCRAGLALNPGTPAEVGARARRRPRPGPLHDGEPRLGRPEVPPGLARQVGRLRGADRARGLAIEVDGGIDADTRAGARGRGRRCSWPARRCSAPPTYRVASARSGTPGSTEYGQPYGRRICLRPQSFPTPCPAPSSSSTTTPPSVPAPAPCRSPRGSRSWGRPPTGRRRSRSAPSPARGLLLDVQLADMDGFDVCPQITSHGSTRS